MLITPEQMIKLQNIEEKERRINEILKLEKKREEKKKKT